MFSKGKGKSGWITKKLHCSMPLPSNGSFTLSTKLTGPSNYFHFCSYFFYFIPFPFSSPFSPHFTYLILHFPPPFLFFIFYLLWSLILSSSLFLPFLFAHFFNIILLSLTFIFKSKNFVVSYFCVYIYINVFPFWI